MGIPVGGSKRKCNVRDSGSATWVGGSPVHTTALSSLMTVRFVALCTASSQCQVASRFDEQATVREPLRAGPS